MPYFAEVIESSLSNFTGQTWQWDDFPEFGSLVTVDIDDNIQAFGLVYDVATKSIDSSRTPIAYQKTEQELKQEMPHIFEFLHTTFTCITLGYTYKSNKQKIYYQLAPKPPKIHSFIRTTETQDLIRFFNQDYFLHVILNYATNIAHDELILALLKYLKQYNILTTQRLNRFIQTYAQVSNNYKHVKLFLKRIEQLID